MTNSGRNWRNKDRRKESTIQTPKRLCHWGGDIISVFIVEFAYYTLNKKQKTDQSTTLIICFMFNTSNNNNNNNTRILELIKYTVTY